MPSTSPGPATASSFTQILPGRPTDGLQSLTSLVFRQKRYIAYISGPQLNILSAPNVLVHAVTFDENPVSVAAENESGKLAVASRKYVWVLEPTAQGWTKARWEIKLLLLQSDSQDENNTLSWGDEGELLVGSDRNLSLYSTLPTSRSSTPASSPIGSEHVEDRSVLWSQGTSVAIHQCQFSPSASLIASSSRYDRFVKIWRRLSFEQGLFDHAYLPHPAPVTHLEWRPHDESLEAPGGSGVRGRYAGDVEVLYTIAADGVLRVWRTGNTHEDEVMMLHTSINLIDAIPQSPSFTVKGTSPPPTPRYAFIIPSSRFTHAVASAVAGVVGVLGGGKPSHGLEHLKHVSSKEPDVLVALDGHGRMSAWGLQSVGHKRRPDTPNSKEPFHIAHAEQLAMKLRNNTNVRFHCWMDNDRLSILIHSFEGVVEWWQSSVEGFFSTALAGSERLKLAASWTGHDTAIREMSRNKSQLVSRDVAQEVRGWRRAVSGALALDAIIRDGAFPGSRAALLPSGLVTGVDCPKLSAKNERFGALVAANGTELRIFDLPQGYLEYQHNYPNAVKHLCFSTTSGNGASSFLAVAFDLHVDILVCGRVPFNSRESAWRLAKQISLAGFDLTISAVQWLCNGTLTIAAGTAIFIADKSLDADQLGNDIRQLLFRDIEPSVSPNLESMHAEISTPLPVWHPDLLLALITHDHASAATMILNALTYKLKFYVEGTELDPLLGLHISDLISTAEVNPEIDFKLFDDILLQLDENRLPHLSNEDQDRLKLVVEAIGFLLHHFKALDVCARTYLMLWKLKVLEQEQERQANGHLSNGKTSSTLTQRAPKMSWREIAFAYHSRTQQPLLDILIVHYDNKISWQTAGPLGIARWLDHDALPQLVEAIAQSEYRSNNPPDPISASLFYLALGKKQTLLALWRIAVWHKEQKSTMNFLRRDFSQPEARTAARKNAYALMGRRRFNYAAAFFLLAEDAASAINVLAGQCEDVPLAVLVARLFCGDASPELCKLLETRLIPVADEKGDRWLACWAMSVMGRTKEAEAALVQPLKDDVVRRWRQDDPLVMILCAHLRTVEPSSHWPAILRTTRVMRRQGLDLMALDLACKWNFKAPKKVVRPVAASRRSSVRAPVDLGTDTPGAGLPSAFDGFMTPVQSTQPKDDKAEREEKAAELLKRLQAKKAGMQRQQQQQPAAFVEPDEKKPQPTQFKEPDTNSLLDSFGF